MVNPEFFKQSRVRSSIPFRSRIGRLTCAGTWCAARRRRCSEPFVNEDFAFNREYMNGQKENQARWKRCVRRADDELGEALGQLYVDKTFGAEGKKRTLMMVDTIEKAMAEDFQSNCRGCPTRPRSKRK